MVCHVVLLTESFAGMLSANRSSSVHCIQILSTLSFDSVQLRIARWLSVAWCESMMLVTNVSPRLTLSDSRSVSDLSGQDQVRVKSIMVVQKAGVLFAGVGAYWVSSARWRRRGKGDITGGSGRDDS